MRIVVTGGAGFIGSNLVDSLLEEGHTVTVVDNLSTGKFDNLMGVKEAAKENRFSFLHIDIRDDAMLAAFKGKEQDAVIHLAAQPDVRVSVKNPVMDADVNVLGTINVLKMAADNGVKRFINTSSGGCVYGEPESIPVSEEAPRRPDSPYGVSKLVAEEYIRYFERTYGISCSTLALANVYGPRQNAFGEAGVVAIFIGKILAGEECTIFGNGEQTRDFVYVDDVVDAYRAALSRGDGEFMNIGTGLQTSVNELYQGIADIMDWEEAAAYAPARDGELDHIALDAGRAGKVLKWKPRTSLQDGLSRTVDWYRQNLRR
ncbi:MAG: GDP-mannose 4,6-dehydratase [Actinomycetota bacterium]|nr:GDP-mannose 4,6-dehydratase [Actinomycetota bacterium]MDD5665874.1 GDP-mannose 4,6-dehydratase [Actinomycetota bacterium]